jgi:WD40 repeat protein
MSCSTDKTLRIWNTNRGYHEILREGHDGPVRSVFALSNGRLLSQGCFGGCLLWSPVLVKEEGFGRKLFQFWSSPQEGFRCESLSWEEFDLLKAGSVELGYAAADYSISRGRSNSAVSGSYGRVFVDGPVDWVVKVGDIIVVFQDNGKDHWFREVSC